MLFPFLLLLFLPRNGDSARVLGVLPTPSYSHQIVFRPIWKELAKRGHEVVVITTDLENSNMTNIREIDVSFTYDLWLNKYKVFKQFVDDRYNILKNIPNFYMWMRDICDKELSHPPVRDLITNKSEHFDLVVVENMVPIMMGFAERFKCPSVAVTTLDFPNMYHTLLGSPDHPVAYPDPMLPFIEKMNFLERLSSALYNWLTYAILVYRDTTADQQVMEAHFGKNMPDIFKIMQNVSIVFNNVNPITSTRALGPNFILFGDAVHLQNSEPLPKDLQEYLDGAEKGAIYFSFGTNLRSDMISPNLIQTMMETFKDLPYKVVWKYDKMDIPNLPENVRIFKWLPQQDVLKHPNVKIFIFQGGLQSMEEAIFSNVPLIGIPFVFDQDVNVIKMAEKGIGLCLYKETLTKESFKEAILEVINNPSYKERTIEISELYKDQPMSGLEKVIWWMEYVMRHKGAHHLRSPFLDLPFYKSYLLDVIGFVLVIMFIFLFITAKTIVFIKNIVFGQNYGKKFKQK